MVSIGEWLVPVSPINEDTCSLFYTTRMPLVNPFLTEFSTGAFSLRWCPRKTTASVVKNGCVPDAFNVDDQVWFPVPVHISHRYGDNSLLLASIKNGKSCVDVGMLGVPSWYFNHRHLGVKVKGNEVRGVGFAVLMTHNRVQLEGLGRSIEPIVLCRFYPRAKNTIPEDDYSDNTPHANTKGDK